MSIYKEHPTFERIKDVSYQAMNFGLLAELRALRFSICSDTFATLTEDKCIVYQTANCGSRRILVEEDPLVLLSWGQKIKGIPTRDFEDRLQLAKQFMEGAEVSSFRGILKGDQEIRGNKEIIQICHEVDLNPVISLKREKETKRSFSFLNLF